MQVMQGTHKEMFAVSVSLKGMLDITNSLVAYSGAKTIMLLIMKSVRVSSIHSRFTGVPDKQRRRRKSNLNKIQQFWHVKKTTCLSHLTVNINRELKPLAKVKALKTKICWRIPMP